MTDVELDLLTDPHMYLVMEEGLLGGISMISNRFCKANSLYVPNYNHKQETSYAVYLDANKLSWRGMSQPLPTYEFDWFTEQEISTLDIEGPPDDTEQGVNRTSILEVDLRYPE